MEIELEISKKSVQSNTDHKDIVIPTENPIIETNPSTQSQISRESKTGENSDIKLVRKRTATIEKVIVSNKEFLQIVTRSSILLTIIIPFMLSISMIWSLHRFLLNTSHYSMCWALLVMEIDSFIGIICVLLLFKYSDKAYNMFCKCSCGKFECLRFGADFCCNQCCVFLAKRARK